MEMSVIEMSFFLSPNYGCCCAAFGLLVRGYLHGDQGVSLPLSSVHAP